MSKPHKRKGKLALNSRRKVALENLLKQQKRYKDYVASVLSSRRKKNPKIKIEDIEELNKSSFMNTFLEREIHTLQQRVTL